MMNAPVTPGRGSPSQPIPGPASQPVAGPPSQRRLKLSGPIEIRIEATANRERQRVWLINTVLLAQTLVTLVLAPAYLIPSVSIPVLIALAASLVIYITAFFINRSRRHPSMAIYTMIIGGAAVTTALLFINALTTHSGAHTAEAALFFLPIIIEAGLFLSPELTLTIAAIGAVLTASGILLALALANDSSSQLSAAYLVMVYALGLEALVGYLSWQLAQFIYEKETAAQMAEDLRFAQARLDAFQEQMADQRRQLQREAGLIQVAVSNMLGHEYETRLEISDGELAPLAASLNLLFERLRSTNELERKVRRMEADAVPLVGAAGRIAEPSTLPPSSEVVSDTALYPVSVALNNAQTVQARRMAQLLQLAANVMDALHDEHRVLTGAANDSIDAQRKAGELVAATDTLTNASQRLVELIAQARRLLAMLLPRAVTTAAAERDPLASMTQGSGDLSGLGLDLGLITFGSTKEYPALPSADTQAENIAPLTRPISPLEAEAGEVSGEHVVFAQGEIPAQLVDTWELLRQLHEQLAQGSRQAANVARDMGILSRLVRQTDVNMVTMMRALEATLRQAEQLQSLASGATPGAESDDAVRQMSQGNTRRPPTLTRPLNSDQTRLPETGALALPGEEGSGATLQPNAPTPAPGSLRVQDLVDLDANGQPGSGALDASKLPPDANEQE